MPSSPVTAVVDRSSTMTEAVAGRLESPRPALRPALAAALLAALLVGVAAAFAALGPLATWFVGFVLGVGLVALVPVAVVRVVAAVVSP